MNPAITLNTLNSKLELKNPIMSASGTFGYGSEFMPYGDISTLGAIIVKGLSLKARAGNPLPRIAETPCGMLNAVGLQNDGVESFVKEKLPKLPHGKVPIIANIYATKPEEFAELADILSVEEGVSALEVNISCPNVKAGGVLFGQDPKMATNVVEAVKKKARNTPIIVKLSPNVSDIASIAMAIEASGADMISCINTLTGMAVDIYNKKPMLANKVGGLSGPAIKPVALRCVWQVAKAVKIPVIGLGGISSAEDVLEFMLVGASAVQIGTASFTDPTTIFKIIKDLPLLCDKLGINNLEEYRNSLILD